MSVHVLITRPAPGDAEFADLVRARLGCGVPVNLSPVLRIEKVAGHVSLGPARHLIVTSRHAVQAVPARDLPVWVVGEKVADAARAAGLRVEHAAPDGAALVDAMLKARPEGPCLHLRGEHVAVDMVAALAEAGIDCAAQVVYRQIEEPLSGDARSLMNGKEPVILPVFSPRSCAILFGQGPFAAPVVVLALSAAVARAVPSEAATRIMVADRPDGAAMAEALDEALAIAKRLEGHQGAQ